ncbi:MAG: hypothetical protein JSS35_13190 [Proteobacteria bacterium]|nr:hypothetical protein [Pseudomonadota bacterium]
MTADPNALRGLFVRMTLVCSALALAAALFAVAYFAFGVGWAIWGFVGFIAAAFVAQLWFVRGFARAGKGN